MPQISIILPIYNAEKFLHETIDSVLCQTFTDFELLALDDASTDRSAEIIHSCKDSRIRYISCPHDFVGTLNKGIDLAIGKYIALFDHDDIMMPYRLQIQYEFMESNPNIAACGGYMHSFGTNSWTIKRPLIHRDIMLYTLLHCPILNPTGFIRRQILTDNHLKYERGYSFAADYKFWSEMGKTGTLAAIPKVLTLYRRHDEQTITKYHSQCLEGVQKIKIEMLDYFLSHLKKEDELADAIDRDFIPAIDYFGEMGFFSEKVLFRFMYEMVGNLMKKGLIEI